MEAVERSETHVPNGEAVVPRLNPRQERFVQEYLVDLNGARAYASAGYRATGASARANASKLLTIPNVRSAIAAARRERAERLELKADEVVRELARVAFSDIGVVACWGTEDEAAGDGSESKQFLVIRPSDCLLPGERAAIKEIRKGKYGLEIELHDKVAALVALAKHFGLLNGEGKKDGDTVDGVPRIPLATLRLLQKRDEELQRKRKEIERVHGRGGNSQTG